jgi:putative toxin-antitoxin system antitoxin component (TIGR02293 family)
MSTYTSRVQEMPPTRHASLAGVIGRQIHAVGDGLEPAALVGAVRAGIPLAELRGLRDSLDLPMEKIAERIGMSRATFHRRQKAGVLSPEESDRALRLARIVGHAITVFESEANARLWLKAPQAGLGGEVPLDYAETEVGAREVENLLGRIDYGVYS